MEMDFAAFDAGFDAGDFYVGDVYDVGYDTGLDNGFDTDIDYDADLLSYKWDIDDGQYDVGDYDVGDVNIADYDVDRGDGSVGGYGSLTDQVVVDDSKESEWEKIDVDEVRDMLGRDSLWEETPFNRGRDFEELEEANIGGNFPTIDDIDSDTGTATSLKTLDVTAETYEDTGKMESKVESYIDDLSDFDDTIWHQNGEEIAVSRDDIDQLALVLGIPAGKASNEQVESLLKLEEYASSKGVQLVIKEIP
ncbi:MAG: hypothetical protein HYZ49_05870 [Chloroflexi bacterium]|nr:hypothetical protein [Chloroflexota bacterium]